MNKYLYITLLVIWPGLKILSQEYVINEDWIKPNDLPFKLNTQSQSILIEHITSRDLFLGLNMKTDDLLLLNRNGSIKQIISTDTLINHSRIIDLGLVANLEIYIKTKEDIYLIDLNDQPYKTKFIPYQPKIRLRFKNFIFNTSYSFYTQNESYILDVNLNRNIKERYSPKFFKSTGSVKLISSKYGEVLEALHLDQDSLYSSTDILYPKIAPIIYIDQDQRKISYTFPYSRNIYELSFDDILKSKIGTKVNELSLKNFNLAQGIPFDDYGRTFTPGFAFNKKEQLLLKRNSSIERLMKFGDNYLVIHSTQSANKKEFYISIVDLNGNILGDGKLNLSRFRYYSLIKIDESTFLIKNDEALYQEYKLIVH